MINAPIIIAATAAAGLSSAQPAWDNQTAAQLPVTTVDFTRTGGSLSSRNRIKLDDFNGRNRDG